MVMEKSVSYMCNLCANLPETAFLYRCPKAHQFCKDCFNRIQLNRPNPGSPGSFCPICVDSTTYDLCNINPDVLRPSCSDDKRLELVPPHDSPSMCNARVSRQPQQCIHDDCRKFVAVNSLVCHFRHDHCSIPTYTIVRSEELRLPLDVAVIKQNRSVCLAMVTLFEPVQDGDEEALGAKTAMAGGGHLPVNTFWLMVTGSAERLKATSYAFFWLYSNCDARYWYTLEVASQKDGVNVSTFCSTVGLLDRKTLGDFAANFNCLFLNYSSIVGLLCEGSAVTLRLTVHALNVVN